MLHVPWHQILPLQVIETFHALHCEQSHVRNHCGEALHVIPSELMTKRLRLCEQSLRLRVQAFVLWDVIHPVNLAQ